MDWLASYFLIKDEGRYRPLLGMLSESPNEADLRLHDQ